MLAKINKKTRFFLKPALVIWLLSSSMAVCFAMNLSGTHGDENAVPAIIAETMHEHEVYSGHNAPHHEGAVITDHSNHTGHSSDCCNELEYTQCCDEPDVIKIDTSPDRDFQLIAHVPKWLTFQSAANRAISPTLDFYLIYSSLPRLHLLLSVFLN